MNTSFAAEWIEELGDRVWQLMSGVRWFIILMLAIWILRHLLAIPLAMGFACYDVSQGHYKVIVRNTPDFYSTNTFAHSALMNLRYDVDINRESFPTLPQPQDTYREVYARTAMTAINLVHGKDIFAECLRDADAMDPDEGWRIWAMSRKYGPNFTKRYAKPSAHPGAPITPVKKITPPLPPLSASGPRTILDLRNPEPPRRPILR
ncbi:MAG: hypothetical protein ACAI35_05710 [Candidatus Methylacidiphilales bacterium]|nr:hypothetical protein [Candidatus Methylacidiphilales bacterium]